MGCFWRHSWVKLTNGISMKNKFIAHYRSQDRVIQTVSEHLKGVAAQSKKKADKIGLPEVGELLGLLHDLGKYSDSFQKYIGLGTGIIDPDIDGVDADMKGLKGKIDHSTAGAQWIWQHFKRYGLQGRLAGQILAVCLASHHGGMLDCLKIDGKNEFFKRMQKGEEKTHLQECLKTRDNNVIESLERIASDKFLKQFLTRIASIVHPQKKEHDRLKHFRLGFFTRFLFSCLIDADRLDSADFEIPENISLRNPRPVDWQTAIDRLEEKLAGFQERNHVDELRNKISRHCLNRAIDPQGIYTLTVPTGGGKTFASIRFGLHHAKVHNLDHIIYIIPYTSIIEQNAQVVKDVVEKKGDPYPWVLEHHSNLEPELQTWHSKLSSESWDTPIIFTTMVQFLEVLFGGGTRGCRRLHNLARSVIIFDEIQSLPVNCVHLFCNVLQFLTDHTNTTAVLCTATQPLLTGVNRDYGAIDIPDGNELAGDAAFLFKELKRVDIKDMTRPEGWNEEEIADFSLNQMRENGNFHTSQVYVINPNEEAIDLLEDIKIGRDKAKRVLEEGGHEDFLSPSAIESYFSYYFYERQDTMTYPLSENQAARKDNLLNLLSDNPFNVGREQDPQKSIFTLQQSFKAAGRAFKAIDAPTQAAIVQYKEGKAIVAELCAEPEPAKAYDLLKKAQKYSVNLFPNVWEKLKKVDGVRPVRQGEEIYYLDERHYSPKFGVSIQMIGEMDTAIV